MNQIPIVYSPHYNISFFGVEKLHPFDSAKYGKIFQHLIDKAGIQPDSFFVPPRATADELLLVHSVDYLRSLEKSPVVAEIAELEMLSGAPNFLLQRFLLRPMQYGTGGTILGAELALKYGCLSCHNVSMKIVGPSYRDIAAKYKTDAEARAKIAEQMHKGGSGKWGPIIMPPFPQISPGETKALTDWILGQK